MIYSNELEWTEIGEILSIRENSNGGWRVFLYHEGEGGNYIDGGGEQKTGIIYFPTKEDARDAAALYLLKRGANP